MEYDDDSDNYFYISTPSGSVSEKEGQIHHTFDMTYSYNHEDDESEEPLQVITQPAQDGYIINNQCFLTWQQWHTILPSLSSEWVKCAVCEIDCEKQLSIKHVASPEHLEQLGAAPPLAKYDRSIIRKFGHQYYCGVCNNVFFEKEELEHIDDLPHKQNLQFAINKASDLRNDKSFTKKLRIDHIQYPCEDDSFGISGDTFINNDNEKKSTNSQNSYDCATEQRFEGKMSYADAVKTTKSVTKYRGFLDIDLGTKTLKITFDSWHMLVNLKDKFWCMVCKLYDRFKDKHCTEDLHLNKLSQCLVVEEYKDEEYFIRKVDEKFYHCGHCNNLQMIHQMQDHVIVNHSKKRYKNINMKSDSSSKALSKVYR